MWNGYVSNILPVTHSIKNRDMNNVFCLDDNFPFIQMTCLVLFCHYVIRLFS